MYHVMIVDDETLIQDSLSHFINTRLPDYQVTGIYGNGADALEAFQENPAEIIITDIRMPVMDGLELVQKLRQQSPFCVPIIISGYSEFTYAKTAMKAGVIHYLLKPIDFWELRQSLNAATAAVRQNQLLSSSNNYLQDEQELFFIDLISGRLKFSAMLISRFNELNFPFSLSESGGIFLRVSMLSEKYKWQYGKETICTAFCNLLQMLYRPNFVCSIFRTHNHYDFLLINPNASELNFSNLCAQAATILSLSIQAIPLFAFRSLEDLGNNIHFSILPNSFSQSEPEQSEKHELIQKAILYMNEHYGDDLTREDVSSMVYMSSAHFSRCFKQEVGISFLDYLTSIRMKKAIELMNTNMKIQDIGKKVGYPSRNRFFINFRNYTSYSPTEYRRNILKIMI